MTTVTFNSVNLCGADTSTYMDQPADLTLGGQSLVDVAQIIGRNVPNYIDRLNEEVTMSFTTRRKHANEAAAELFVISHRAECMGVHAGSIIMGSTTLTLAQMRVAAQGGFQGATTIFRYSIIGHIAAA